MPGTDHSDERAPRKVVIVTYDGAKLMDISGPLQAFSDACFESGRPAYDVVLASEAGGAVATDTRVKLETVRLDDAVMASVDTLLVAGADLIMPAAATASLRARLVNYLDWPRRLGSVCTGAFILAQLGILDSRDVTTHWGACSRLAQQHPAINVKPDAIFVTSDHIWTSAGVSAGIDMALAMIEADLGHLTALNVARGMVLFLKRPGGQSQFSIELRQQMRDARGRFEDLHDWIRTHLDADLSIPALADAARMSPRNFARVYLRETGESPARVVERLRIEAARRLLESAHDPIQVIARRTGFGDDERMRRAFTKVHGVSPQDYRRRFGAPKV
ncbi:GlxA family transcriptional regulator [Caballeronia sp. CLC5]|uniref:GlxA family transcriptional regulator n=1 Tax=Caballeronia sp. CLC5 TaxID=2906764 RepID=UPI001F1B18FF|nr:helix-turn-helix domain-containing protein [Caballeronia sp. CLC5]MCE4574703.1 helix-turn-helix domain-containing protein [Caballeronia sp. CLC5]